MTQSMLFFIDFKIPHFKDHKKMSYENNISTSFSNEVVILHGFPRSIVSDRDTRFVGHFWRTFWKMLGPNLKFSLEYHP